MDNSRNILALTAILSIVIASCSVEKNRRALSFFFDGVPVADTSSIESPVMAGGTTGVTTDTSRARIVSVYNLHYPYEEKECMSCHDENSPGQMVLPEPDLCYMCHDDFNNLYEAVHAPVDMGFCTQCHNAHQSRNDYLLKFTGQALCTDCHDLELVQQNEMHSDIGDTECTLCHNPHGGADRFLMR